MGNVENRVVGSDSPAAGDSEEHVRALAEKFLAPLQLPAGFRNSEQAAMVVVYMSKTDMPSERRDLLVQEIERGFSKLDDSSGRNVCHGLAEVRAFIEAREPGVRTMVAMSLWEQIVDCFPIELQYLAREGQRA